MRCPLDPRRGLRALACATLLASASASAQEFGSEKAIPKHLAPGEEIALNVKQLFAHGRLVFSAKFTLADGHGRPLAKGNFAPLADLQAPLVFPRNMDRVSSPEASSCAGCHMDPLPGGSGEFLTNAFVLAERFDHATFDAADATPTKGAVDENGTPVTLDTIGNGRQTPHLFGSGYVEMLAREISDDLRALRDSLFPGSSVALKSKGISFGTLSRMLDGTFDTSQVEGLAAVSLASTGALDPPSLLVRPFSWGGASITLRQFTVSAYNHHMGIQAKERVGPGLDPDGDALADELSVGDVTAAVLFQAALPPPGRVIPKGDETRAAIKLGEQVFVEIACSSCHVPCLPLTPGGFDFTEPSPFSPAGNLQEGDLYHSQFGTLAVDLGHKSLPKPRLAPNKDGIIEVPLYTDFKLHDVTDGPTDPNAEPLDMHQNPSSPDFFAGNTTFITPRLWGVGSTGPYFHHGKFTTLREAILAHGGEAAAVRDAFVQRSAIDQRALIEFLQSLQVLPENAKAGVVDASGKKLKWQKFPWTCGQDVPPVPN